MPILNGDKMAERTRSADLQAVGSVNSNSGNAAIEKGVEEK